MTKIEKRMAMLFLILMIFIHDINDENNHDPYRQEHLCNDEVE
jgi:hypothetical protein